MARSCVTRRPAPTTAGEQIRTFASNLRARRASRAGEAGKNPLAPRPTRPTRPTRLTRLPALLPHWRRMYPKRPGRTLMCRSRILSAIALSVLVCHPAVSYADAGLLRTIQPLDETRGYCLDIRGEGETLRLDEPLQLHTCKYGGPIGRQRFQGTARGGVR